MGKHTFGEYSAYETPGGLRFQKQNKLIAESKIPTEVATFLRNKFGDDSGKVAPKEQVEKKFPRPSEEELAKMREESLKVPEELQMTPEEIAARTPKEEDSPITESDFENVPQDYTDDELKSAMMDESDFLETVSIHTAPLKDIAQALYDRFGIYTVYLDTLPQIDDISPVTGNQFTKHHLGLAYQAALYAGRHGYPQPETLKKYVDEGRQAHSDFREKGLDPVAQTVRESREANDFRHRTSVRGTKEMPTTRIEHIRGTDGIVRAVQIEIPAEERQQSYYDQEEDERIVQPGIGKQVINPNW